MKKFLPFLEWLPLAKKYWKDDLIAGITGTVIVIPQAVAFAMIAGLPPIYGFYTAMITPVIAALFGSSYHLISGPTTAISIVVFASISKIVDPSNIEAYVGLTLVLTFMAGVIQILMGLLKMGKLVNFVSHSVIIGFTAGAGILIAFKQLKYVFGLSVPQGSEFYEIIYYIIKHISEINLYVFAVAIGTVIIALIVKLLVKPLSRFYMLIAMVAGSILAIIFGGDANGIYTVGEIPSSLPSFIIPEISMQNIKLLGGGAFVLALLGLVEAVAIGKSIALNSHQKIDGNQEFIGQGLSNMIASFFSSYAGSGSFTRSGVNYQAGAKTPMSAIFAAIGLVLVLLLGAKYASYLPKAAMGGIILLVGYNLVDVHHIKTIFKSSKRESIVLISTLLGTLFLDLEFSLLIGILLSLFFYLEKTSNINIAQMGFDARNKLINIKRDETLNECPQMRIVRIDGSIYFGAIEKISDYFAQLYSSNTKFVLIIAQGINFIDLAGAEWLSREVEKFKLKNGRIIIVGLKSVSQDILDKGGFIDKIGKENIMDDKKLAITEMYNSLDKSKCDSCSVNVFKEC